MDHATWTNGMDHDPRSFCDDPLDRDRVFDKAERWGRSRNADRKDDVDRRGSDDHDHSRWSNARCAIPCRIAADLTVAVAVVGVPNPSILPERSFLVVATILRPAVDKAHRSYRQIRDGLKFPRVLQLTSV